MKRRRFIQTISASAAMPAILSMSEPQKSSLPGSGDIVVASTWDFKLPVNETSANVLEQGGSLVDAVEQGIVVVENDPSVTSVGQGGFPDRDGHLTLDACIMDSEGNAGSVMFLEGIEHPISVARKVMEQTPHVMLAGEGALRFAVGEGFRERSLLTENARKAYKEWLTSSGYNPPVGKENHDTVGLLVRDGEGRLAGGCSTSGAAWKMRGRVGDSPIIGAGLFVDNEAGAATSSGLGEAVIKIAGSAIIVELMRQGVPPEEACAEAVDRIFRRQPRYRDDPDFFVGFLALRKDGAVGAIGSRKGFQYSLYSGGTNRVIDAPAFRR
ncbi:MAG: N(4)-(beta-N-acetylglucosaminyl)-L-asparaginase [Ignavibacteria bacterium]|nr:N(4)-(beta-N-acetylglucosaminyl)-L-asparaginase [Ignavibacteria bacterium]